MEDKKDKPCSFHKSCVHAKEYYEMCNLALADTTVYFKDCRDMKEVASNSVTCVITSPPYFDYKDYNTQEQIGMGSESYECYIKDLKKVWKNCLRVLQSNGKLCINVTNMKSRKGVEGSSFLYPILADITKSCIDLGFIYYDDIIWVKGKANAGALNGKPLFGSYPYPPNFKILDSIQETILIFRKEGKPKKLSKAIKERSRLSKGKWLEYTQGVWHIQPERQNNGHCATFPVELPKRLISLYSFKDDVILDPFLGSGTTLLASKMMGRKGIGYEINEDYKDVIMKKATIQAKNQTLHTQSKKNITDLW